MKNEKGYTLVEILIALAILTIMSAPVFNIFLDSIRINKMADDQYKADIIAQKFVEDLRVNDFPDQSNTTTIYDGFTVNVLYTDLNENSETIVDSTFNLPNIDMGIELYEDNDQNIAVRNSEFSFQDLQLSPNIYQIRVYDTSPNSHEVSISHTDSGPLNLAVVGDVVIDDNRELTLRIFKNSNFLLDDTQLISFNVSNNSDVGLEIYVVNDELDNIRFTIAPDSRAVKLVRNLTDSVHVTNNTFRSRDVEVTVSKNNTEYTKLKTVISK